MKLYRAQVTNSREFDVELTSMYTDSLKTIIMSLVDDIRYDRVTIVFIGFDKPRMPVNDNEKSFIWSNKTNERVDIINNLDKAFYEYKMSNRKYNYVSIYLE